MAHRSCFPRALVGAALLLIGQAEVAAAQIPKGDIVIELETVASGLVAPLGATNAGDGSGRLFIWEQRGQILVLKDGAILPTPFLDISPLLAPLGAFLGERGLLGVAFHPRYAKNGRFFIRYSSRRPNDPSSPCGSNCHEEILAEYRVSDTDPDVANPVGTILYRIDHPQGNHNAGGVAFGKDGHLYFSQGDGGGRGDGLADIPPSHGPLGHGQNIETALGAMLRIDVDGPPDPGLAYAIPKDNPFVGKPGVDEIYAYGFRNPYTFSFDDGPGGDGALYVGDVGQNLFEELDIVERGGNYGWATKEGFACFDPFAPTNPPASCSDTGPSGELLLDPLVDYSHAEGGRSIIAGFVYRGTRSPSLIGKFLFGDFLAPSPGGGALYYLERSDPTIRRLQIGEADAPYPFLLKGFGEGEDGEVYACGTLRFQPIGNTGVVQRIVSVENPVLDVVPGSDDNVVDLTSESVVPVALLGSDVFDVLDVDPTTLAFGPGAAAPIDVNRLAVYDVNDDGELDLLTHYVTSETGIAPGDTVACLTGQRTDASPFRGCDNIRTVSACGKGFEAALVLPALVLASRRRWGRA